MFIINSIGGMVYMFGKMFECLSEVSEDVGDWV